MSSVTSSFFQRADLAKSEQYLMEWLKLKVNRVFVLSQQLNTTENMLNSLAAMGKAFSFTKIYYLRITLPKFTILVSHCFF